MRAGYGRGYYGSGQLAPIAHRPRTSWFKIVAVVGVGAAVMWFLWPRSPAPESLLGSGGSPEPEPPPTPSSSVLPVSARGAPQAVGAFMKQIEDDARARGFVSVGDYEDSVVATAKQLQSTGANVVLAPHLQHLTPRLTS